MTRKSDKRKFTFADAKKRIKELEEQLANTILDTRDNVFTKSELTKIRIMEILIPISFLVNIVLGFLLFSK